MYGSPGGRAVSGSGLRAEVDAVEGTGAKQVAVGQVVAELVLLEVGLAVGSRHTAAAPSAGVREPLPARLRRDRNSTGRGRSVRTALSRCRGRRAADRRLGTRPGHSPGRALGSRSTVRWACQSLLRRPASRPRASPWPTSRRGRRAPPPGAQPSAVVGGRRYTAPHSLPVEHRRRSGAARCGRRWGTAPPPCTATRSPPGPEGGACRAGAAGRVVRAGGRARTTRAAPWSGIHDAVTDLVIVAARSAARARASRRRRWSGRCARRSGRWSGAAQVVCGRRSASRPGRGHRSTPLPRVPVGERGRFPG
ncbi:hypothetical protein SAMN05216207_103321 [Pseudonocardia ammonioxydans]|uniref:Uncharacterized protein n=1 Tax=Pseudonocardia ammonioxydans TaxID=260086 RepID=A0A1I5EWB1_PSUAM|nr:hypothetical protein SAMN05216207_103321 [Pseudonocardia ammonioxydans]